MAAALRQLDEQDNVRLVQVSALYRTPPWGRTDQPDFLNAVAEIETGLPPRGLLELCLETERVLKRERHERWGPRVIDIDILTYGQERVSEKDLEVPHPRMLERAFVLVPLAELAPDLVIHGSPVKDHLDRLDASGIEQISDDREWWRVPASSP